MNEESFLVKKDKKKINNNRIKVFIIIFALILSACLISGIAYSIFNYTRVGNENVINTGILQFDYQEGTAIQLSNEFPISETDLTNNNKLTFTISGHNTLEDGVSFNIYAIHGDDVTGKTWLTDNIVKMKFVPPANGDGFSITTNNYATATTPTYTNGKALIASGLIKNTTELTTKSYELYVWIDENLAFVSSTTKRTNNAEGNPSMADSSAGTTTATRYMRNNNVASTVTLYPADEDSTGKIIYTTNEYNNSHYTIKLLIEAQDA